MEEKKKIATEVAGKEQKLSYEKLNEVCSQLYQQNQVLMQRLQQADMTNMFKRLDYLFKVVELESSIKDAEFITACVQEIKEAMSFDKKEEKEES